MKYRYLFQIKEDESNMAKSLAALVDSYKCMDVIFIYEDTEDGKEILPSFLDSFHDKNIGICYKSAISTSATHDQINEELRKLMTIRKSIIIVHMSPSLASSIFLNAKGLGMVREGYVWILTEKTVDVLRSSKAEVIESIQGALGFRPYVPASSSSVKQTMGMFGKEPLRAFRNFKLLRKNSYSIKNRVWLKELESFRL